MVLIDRLMTGGRDFTTQMRGAICRNWINVFLVFVPVGIAAELTHINPAAVFAINAVAIVPLANFLGHATESAAHRLGDAQGAFLSISFGNAVELIILTTALVKNQIGIVQASLLGSILVNLLLVLGTSFLVGGLRYREQVYNSKATQISACLLSLSVMSLLLPTAFHASFKHDRGKLASSQVLKVSRGTSVVLLLVYGLYLTFQLKSHAYMYASTPQQIVDQESHPGILAGVLGTTSPDDSPSSGRPPERRIPVAIAAAAKSVKRALNVQRRRRLSGSISTGADLPGSSVVRSPAENLPSDAGQRAHDVGRVESGHAPESSPGLSSPAQSSIPRLLPNSDPVTSAEHHHERPVGVARPDLPVSALRRVSSLPDRLDRRSPCCLESVARAKPRGPSPPASESSRLGAEAEKPSSNGEDGPPEMSHISAVVLLLTSTTLVAVCAEFMVAAIPPMLASNPAVNPTFIGLIILPIVGNAAEHGTAAVVASKNKMDLAIGVAVGSSIQISLFVTPFLVLLGWTLGRDMSLYFDLFETISLFVTAFVVNFLVLDGRSNYLEGSLLIAAYVIVSLGAFFYPQTHDQSAVGNMDADAAAP